MRTFDTCRCWEKTQTYWDKAVASGLEAGRSPGHEDGRGTSVTAWHFSEMMKVLVSSITVESSRDFFTFGNVGDCGCAGLATLGSCWCTASGWTCGGGTVVLLFWGNNDWVHTQTEVQDMWRVWWQNTTWQWSLSDTSHHYVEHHHHGPEIQLWHPENIPSEELSYLKVPPNVSLTRSSTIRPESLIFFAELQGLL